MKTSNILIDVKAVLWSESAKSWHLLTKRAPDGKGWSGGSWFPKSQCSFKDGILKLPLWLLQKKSEEGIKFTNLQNELI